ncbi:response regulator [Chitinophaga sp. SYP-B3965]|uniref:LytR/AlgR family response regulator transcription factor n=1 Tax=Chitinophaga sp. SYP-B3965 TaxID=2663120 RepID=UPI0012995D68|nr:LytTR family DNA-binding domain-containing protein [Chitinophaga sp. SYP-B3965]MRG45806.1 response regulator [Chitinophaga sp. SYP-B3965]
MRILIIEDEENAARQLESQIRDLVAFPEFTGVIDNVEDAAALLATKPRIDLIFLDINLSDGLSFEIFKDVQVDIPVVFTTAYDQYAIRAFELNSIDYLLKPIRKEKLQQALDKYFRLENRSQVYTLEQVSKLLAVQPNYKRNFLVPYKDKLIPVNVDEFAWFELHGGTVKGVRLDKTILIMEEKSLEELSDVLDPGKFYRANRQYLISRHVIKEVEHYFSGRLYLKTDPATGDKLLVSKAKAGDFRQWMNDYKY